MLLQAQWRRLNLFRNLPNGEKRIVLAAATVLTVTVAGLRLFGYRRCQSWLRRWAQRGHWPPIADNEFGCIRRTSLLLRLVVRRSPVPGKCLAQSLTLWWLLMRQGIETDLRIGVQSAGGEFQAHAWIEYQGLPVNDTQDVRSRYAVFASSQHRYNNVCRR